MSAKTYILDTSGLMSDPSAIKKFAGNLVILPMVVLEELDKHKNGSGGRAQAVRQVVRYLDKARQYGSLEKGVYIEKDDVRLKVLMHTEEEVSGLLMDKEYNDNVILAQCLTLVKEARAKKKKLPILVTDDIALRVKADSLGIPAEERKSGKVVVESLFEGNPVIEGMTGEIIDEVYSGGVLATDYGLDEHFKQGQYGCLKCGQQSALVYRHQDKILALKNTKRNPYGLTPRSAEQSFCIDMMLNEDVRVCTMTGVSGCGKTLLALACALEMVLGAGAKYEKVILCKVPASVGKELGFLPGDLKQKLAPWMASLEDAYALLSKKADKRVQGRQGLEQLETFGKLEIQSIEHIRGRSIQDAVIIVDEAQNLSVHEIKTIITRIAESSKIIFTGDPFQIDVPSLDTQSNGLTVMIDRSLQDEEARELFRHVHLTSVERSKLVEIYTKIL